MSDLAPLADFPAVVVRVKTMMDGGIRIELDLPETEGVMLSTMHGLRDRYLHVVIYNDDEFQAFLREKVSSQVVQNG